MREIDLTDTDGKLYQAETDGRTVWVHDWEGYTVGRFSAKGIDVHSKTGCLDCRIGQNPWGKPLRTEWLQFIESIERYYSVRIPEYMMSDFADPSDV